MGHLLSAEPILSWALFITLADIEARLSEILGLEVRDLDLQVRSITIFPNGIRSLKTKGSNRPIPLSRRAAAVFQGRRQGEEDGEAPGAGGVAHPLGPHVPAASVVVRHALAATRSRGLRLGGMGTGALPLCACRLACGRRGGCSRACGG